MLKKVNKSHVSCSVWPKLCTHLKSMLPVQKLQYTHFKHKSIINLYISYIYFIKMCIYMLKIQ